VRIIFDLRRLNESSQLDPAHLSLPSFDLIKHLLRSNQDGHVFFSKLDISNCYWSLALPHELHHTFVFETPEHELFAFSRLPFGWNASVAIASRALQQLLPPLPNLDTSLTQYVDDLLIASSSRRDTKQHTLDVLANLHEAGLHHAAKSVIEPDTSIEWLGKTISSSPSTISNTALSRAKSYAQWLHFVSSERPSQRSAMSFTGSIVWTGIHTRLHLPYLSAAHRQAFAANHQLSDRDRNTLLKAVHLANVPWTRNELLWMPPPVDTPLAFCDATTAIGAIVVPFKNLVVSWRIPKHASINQQAAELWTCVQSIKLLSRHNITAALGSDSLTSLFALINLRTPSFNEARAKLLRSASTAIRQLQRPQHLFWVPSELNPADAPSRQHALAAALLNNIPLTFHPDLANDTPMFVFHHEQICSTAPSPTPLEPNIKQPSTSINSGRDSTVSILSTSAPSPNTSFTDINKAPRLDHFQCSPQPFDSGPAATSSRRRSPTSLIN
jgi:hypothetical protein